MLLRDDQQAALAELRATAAGLVVRYRSLSEGDVDERLGALLADVAERRQVLVDELAECARERGDEPTAADLELNQYRALGDRLTAWALGQELSLERIADAEQAWLERLHEIESLAWRPSEQGVIARLLQDARDMLSELQALGSG